MLPPHAKQKGKIRLKLSSSDWAPASGLASSLRLSRATLRYFSVWQLYDLHSSESFLMISLSRIYQFSFMTLKRTC